MNTGANNLEAETYCIRLSLRAGKDLHWLNDDLEPWLETNEDIEEYLRLLDILTLLK